jgi:hypothetical protein
MILPMIIKIKMIIKIEKKKDYLIEEFLEIFNKVIFIN